MAHRKATGSVKNVGGSQPKYLGTKLFAGETAKAGSVIIRQRGSRILSGKNTSIGKDHTIFALKAGKIKFSHTRKKSFDNNVVVKKVVNVISA